MTRPLRLLAALACAAGTSVILPLAAHGDSGLGGFSASGDSNGVDIVIDNATGLAGAHPFTEADLPVAESDFSSGPFGSTLASVFWPGSAGGNFGSLSAELPIPAQLQPLLAQTNDPVRASAQYPRGPADSSYPPGAPGGVIVMTAHADANGSNATAALSAEDVAGIVGFKSAKGTSRSVASTTASADSSSDLKGVSLLGGLIQIGSITSSASATSDGTNSSGHSNTHLGAVTVLGLPASIGSKGLVLPSSFASFGLLAGPVVQSLLTQTVTALGVQVTILPSSQTRKGASDAETSGGVQLKVTPNPALTAALIGQIETLTTSIPGLPSQFATLTTLPGLLQGSSLAVTLGRAVAAAAASPAFADTFSSPAPPAGTTVPDNGPAVASSDTGTTALIPASGVPASLAPTPSSSASPENAAPPLAAAPIGLSTPVAVGLVVLGLLLVGGLAFGLWSLARMLLVEDFNPDCPFGLDNP